MRVASVAISVFFSAEQAEQWEVGYIFPATELFSMVDVSFASIFVAVTKFQFVRFILYTCESTDGEERVSLRYSDLQFVLPGGIEAVVGDMRNLRHNRRFHDLSLRIETGKTR